jgi:hypothetical protein
MAFNHEQLNCLGNSIEVFDAAGCNSDVASGCSPWNVSNVVVDVMARAVRLQNLNAI